MGLVQSDTRVKDALSMLDDQAEQVMIMRLVIALIIMAALQIEAKTVIV